MPTILVVDDSSEMRDVYSLALKREGYSILEADDGHTALEILQTYKPDLILSDVIMPYISGFDMAETIRANPDIQHIPIILLSSFNGQNEQAWAANIGVNAFVGLPIPIEDLVALVHKTLGD